MIRAALLGAMLSGLPAFAEDIPTLFQGGAPGVTLSGSLLLAPSPGAPALAIVSGSGLQDKDFTHQGQQIFRRLAEKLAGQGISTLRYDDRGYGESTGDPQITMADEAADAAAALDHLCGQIGIDPFRIGLIGHSSGGIAVTRALGNRSGAGMAVLLASPTTNGEQVLLWQTAANLKAAGMSDATVAQNNSQVRRLIAATLSSDQ
ncbi:MAG: alpha/beta fold hydrolase, partial [Pseudomonadota bacterium]